MRLRENGANIESHDLHQANFTDGVLYDLPHFRIRSRGSNILSELAHIGPADCSFHRGDDSFEWLLRNDAPSLDIDRAHFHTFDLKVVMRGAMFFSGSQQSKPRPDALSVAPEAAGTTEHHRSCRCRNSLVLPLASAAAAAL